MKVGVIGTLWYNTPPDAYGGTEEVVYNLVQGLVHNGHEVTLFGPATAKTDATLVATVETPLRTMQLGWNVPTYTKDHIDKAFAMAGKFDILHMQLNKHQDYYALALAEKSKTPVLVTPHFKIPSLIFKKDRYEELLMHPRLPFTSISDSQRKGSQLNYIRTVYNGIDLKKFPFVAKPQDYLVWIGRVHPDKGTKEAIQAAKKAGEKLYVMGLVDNSVTVMREYYEQEVKPLINGKDIVWLGAQEFDEKVAVVGGAKAFLNPISWEEPFGLVMVEAQAVGTPVISFAMGAAPEIIDDGKSGYLVNTLDEMVGAIAKVGVLDRAVCRQNVEQRFSLAHMVKGYEEAYTTVIANWPYS